MLKNIKPCISAELIKTMMEMGHSDTLIIADGNFPAYTYAQNVIRADGYTIAEILDAVLYYFPLDTDIGDESVKVMALPEGAEEPLAWADFRKIIKSYEPSISDLTQVDRYEFYGLASDSSLVVLTNDFTKRGNILITKGVVTLDMTKGV